MVPRLHKVSEVDEFNREAVTYRVAPSAYEYSEDLEREKSIRYWSEDYNDPSDTLTRFYPFQPPRERGSPMPYRRTPASLCAATGTVAEAVAPFCGFQTVTDSWSPTAMGHTPF
jgi:hypothetical protein